MKKSVLFLASAFTVVGQTPAPPVARQALPPVVAPAETGPTDKEKLVIKDMLINLMDLQLKFTGLQSQLKAEMDRLGTQYKCQINQVTLSCAAPATAPLPTPDSSPGKK